MMRRRTLICWLLTILLALAPASVCAESRRLFCAPDAPQCGSAALYGQALYVMTNKGLYACALDGGADLDV